MIQVNKEIVIDEGEIKFEFIRASGPGGQNVNKVASAVQLRFDVKNSRSLSDDTRRRLIRQAGKKINTDGILIITAKNYRRQDQNRKEALNRLIVLISKAAEKPKPHKKTRIPPSSRLKRLETKKRRSSVKNLRRSLKNNQNE